MPPDLGGLGMKVQASGTPRACRRGVVTPTSLPAASRAESETNGRFRARSFVVADVDPEEPVEDLVSSAALWRAAVARGVVSKGASGVGKSKRRWKTTAWRKPKVTATHCTECSRESDGGSSNGSGRGG